jgi:hypothetical protein
MSNSSRESRESRVSRVNPYHDVIRVVSEGRFDSHRLAVMLAQRHPTIFMRLVDALRVEREELERRAYSQRTEPGISLPVGYIEFEGRPLDTRTAEFQEIVSLMRDHKKIEAIKKFRTWTGFGLKEAKDFVETRLSEFL